MFYTDNFVVGMCEWTVMFAWWMPLEIVFEGMYFLDTESSVFATTYPTRAAFTAITISIFFTLGLTALIIP